MTTEAPARPTKTLPPEHYAYRDTGCEVDTGCKALAVNE